MPGQRPAMDAVGIIAKARFRRGRAVRPGPLATLPVAVGAGGFLYVLEFDNRTVKCGRTKAPQERAAHLARSAWCWGVRLRRGWVSGLLEEPDAYERSLLAWSRRQDGVFVRNSEYFAGLEYGATIAFAIDLTANLKSAAVAS